MKDGCIHRQDAPNERVKTYEDAREDQRYMHEDGRLLWDDFPARPQSQQTERRQGTKAKRGMRGKNPLRYGITRMICKAFFKNTHTDATYTSFLAGRGPIFDVSIDT